ncbi:hypothetical protein V7S43_005405 [Phytophthora oleae]|uniref:Uncharacterized protein n=1 Tax=Phytophthora oleae TaxID=2107226 RepID=A0ABD3FSW6_9STRA
MHRDAGTPSCGAERQFHHTLLLCHFLLSTTQVQISAKLDLERKVQAKGKKMKVKAAENGMPAVYRWKQQRQK